MADLNALYSLLESTTYYSAPNKITSYAKANPNEAAAVERYWRSGGTRPTVATKFGRFLLDVADEIRNIGASSATSAATGIVKAK